MDLMQLVFSSCWFSNYALFKCQSSIDVLLGIHIGSYICIFAKSTCFLHSFISFHICKPSTTTISSNATTHAINLTFSMVYFFLLHCPVILTITVSVSSMRVLSVQNTIRKLHYNFQLALAVFLNCLVRTN